MPIFIVRSSAVRFASLATRSAAQAAQSRRRAPPAAGSRRASARRPRELVPEPGLLPLGVLPGADGDRLGDRLPRRAGRAGTPPPRGCPTPSSPGAPARWPSASTAATSSISPRLHHLLGPRRDPLVQHRPRHGEPHVPRVDRALRPRRAAASRRADWPVSSATSMARAARCRPPPAKPGIEPAGPAHQLERIEPAGPRARAIAARGRDRAAARGTGPRPAPGRRARCPRRRPAACRARAPRRSSRRPRARSDRRCSARPARPGRARGAAPRALPPASAWRCRCRAGDRPGGSRPRSPRSAERRERERDRGLARRRSARRCTGTLAPAKPSLQLLARQLHDGRPAVHVVRRQLGREEPQQQLAHLALARARSPALTAARQA